MKNIAVITIILLIAFKLYSQQSGRIDNTFNMGGGPNSGIAVLCSQPDGKILAGGSFYLFSGIERIGIVRLLENGMLDSNFVPKLNCLVDFPCGANISDIVIQSDGKIIVAGKFAFPSENITRRIARIFPNGDIDYTFPSSINSFSSMTAQSDGKIIIGGCTNYNGISVKGLIRIFPNGQVDSTFNIFESGVEHGKKVTKVLIQSDGKIIIIGTFNSYKGISCPNFIRINADATIDTTFTAGSGLIGGSGQLALLPNDNLFIAGTYTSYNGLPINGLAELNLDGTLKSDFGFTSPPNSVINCIYVENNDKIVLAGSENLTQINNNPVHGITVISSNGNVDINFSPIAGSNGSINAIIPQPNNKLLLGGAFNEYDNETHNFICRIHAGGSTGVEDALQDKGFAIYPNPANGHITISTKKTNHLHISNMLGQVVYEAIINEGSIQHSIAKFSKGMYYVKVGETVQKLIIE